jgi:hypothetical protein
MALSERHGKANAEGALFKDRRASVALGSLKLQLQAF